MNAIRHLHWLYSLRKSQWSNTRDLQRLQWRKQRQLIEHAYATVPYYRRLFQSVGLTPDHIQQPEDWSLIPITTKAMIQDVAHDDRLARGVDLSTCIERRTSGTTGQPVRIVLSRDEKEIQDMAQVRAMTENRMRFTDRRVVFVAPWQIPKRPYWFQRIGIWQKTYFSVFDDVREQFPLIERIKPDCIAGTPAILKLVALEQQTPQASSAGEKEW